MKDNILDIDEFEPNNSQQPTHPFLASLPLLLVWLLMLVSIPLGILLTDDIHYLAGLVVLPIATFLYFYKRHYGILLTGIMIFLGVFSMLRFSYLSIQFPLILTLRVEVLMLPILAIFGKYHYDTFYEVFREFYYGNDREIKGASLSKKDSFKKRFTNKSKSELEGIIQNEFLLAEAREAAQELLDELPPSSE